VSECKRMKFVLSGCTDKLRDQLSTKNFQVIRIKIGSDLKTRQLASLLKRPLSVCLAVLRTSARAPTSQVSSIQDKRHGVIIRRTRTKKGREDDRSLLQLYLCHYRQAAACRVGRTRQPHCLLSRRSRQTKRISALVVSIGLFVS